MKTPMQKLRATMMTSTVFAKHERMKLRWLTEGNEAQRLQVMAAMKGHRFIAQRMRECGSEDSWGNINYCGVPLCPRCHMRERTVQTAKAIKKTFPYAENENLAFATILFPVQLDFSGMSDLVETEKRRLRTFIDRQRKKDPRWNEFQLLGWWEIDRMSFSDYADCGRNTKLALDDLDFPLLASPDQTIWRPHLHAIIERGELTEQEIAKALRKETHQGRYQVDIQPFRTNRSVANNLKNIVRYSLKFRIESDYKRPDAQDFIAAEELEMEARVSSTKRNWWPDGDIRAYVDWLCGGRSGFQSLRFKLGKASGQQSASTSQRQAANDMIRQRIVGLLSSASISNRSIAGNDNADERGKAINAETCDVDFEVQSLGVSVVCSDKYLMYNNILHDANWISEDVPTDDPQRSKATDGPPRIVCR